MNFTSIIILMGENIRDRLNQALSGEDVTQPVYAVYDWFVINREINWQDLFYLGLGQINHASLFEVEHPHLKIEESLSNDGNRTRKDVRWITDMGELHEWSVDGWVREYMIKSPNDYKIMQRALQDAKFSPTNQYFDESERALGDSGITIGHLGQYEDVGYRRTPLQVIQIDFTGLEQFSFDIAMEAPGLFDLLEMMNAQFLDLFKCVTKTRASHIKLWENLSIETIGPDLFRKYMVPVYEKISRILEGSGQQLHVHYDGRLQSIADDIGRLDLYGIDSLTPPPEGDMSIKEARAHWPEKFFWMHPSLGIDSLPDSEVEKYIMKMIREAKTRFGFLLSEEVPPNWKRTVPLILETLDKYAQGVLIP
ncbi:MAG: hypothetical protein ABFS38_11960 [Bacteroidota bacterium]